MRGFMKTNLWLGIISCLIFMGCRGANSASQADADGNRSIRFSNDSSIQTTPTQTEKEVRVTERAVYASLLNKLVFSGKGGLRPEDTILIYKRTISNTLRVDLAEEAGVNAEVVTDFARKSFHAAEFQKILDVYFEYALVDNNVSDIEAKYPKSRVVLGFSRIGFTNDLKEALLYVEINNYVRKNVQRVYYKVKNENGKLEFMEFGP